MRPPRLSGSVRFQEGSPEMKSTCRVTTVAALLLVALPCISAEPPRHYFTGRVCRGSESVSFQPGDVPCENPLRGVAVTLQNSRGIVVRARTGADGRYSV